MSNRIKDILAFELGGIELFPFGFMAVLSVAFLVSGNLIETGIIGAFALMWSVGFVLFAIGEKLPIWREYVGGGLIMAFLGSAAITHVGWISPDDAKYLTDSVIGNRFLYFLLVALVAGSILAVERGTLIKSVVGLVPVILCALVGATVLGVLVGWVFDIEPARIITHYVLPIMGGGNGAGAIPMSEIYADVTGESGSVYYGFAISVLTIANMIAILTASALNQIGKRFPAWTGNGQLMHEDNQVDNQVDNESQPQPKVEEVANTDVRLNTQSAVFFVTAMLLFSMLLYSLVPKVHLFAWTVLVILLLNVLDVLPDKLKQSLVAVNEWGMRTFIVLVLVAVGLTTNLNDLLEAFTGINILIAAAVVLGAVIGSSISAVFFKFYPIEASIAAGLCMANRGGSGDLEVLGAAKRMALYPYAQISSRVGGGIVLFLAGYLFTELLPGR